MKISLIDGFSGGGEAMTGLDEVVTGTPIRLLDSVVRARERLSKTRRNGFDLNAEFTFVDRNRDACAYLDDVLRRRGYHEEFKDKIELRCADFEALVDQLILRAQAQSGTGRSIFVLDQCGWSAVTSNTIRRIMVELPKSEIILTFAVGTLIRCINEKPEFLRPISKLGFTPDHVRGLINENDDGVTQVAIQRLIGPMLRERFGARFFTRFFIRSQKANSNLWIIHLASHEAARNVMMESHWHIGNSTLHRGRGGIDMTGFDVNNDGMLIDFFGERDAQDSIDQLAQDIPDIIEARGGITTFGDLLISQANNSVATVDQFRAAISLLKAERDLDVMTSSGGSKRGGAITDADRLALPLQKSFNF